MFDALSLPAVILSPITVVGKICIEVDAKIISIIMGLFALPEPSSRRCMAFIPRGVAAPPMPRMLQEMFMQMSSLVVASKFPKIFFVAGERIFDSILLSPLSSITCKIPIHTAYIAHKLRQSLRVSSLALSIEGKMISGFIYIKTQMLATIIQNQILFISNVYVLCLWGYANFDMGFGFFI